MGIAENTDWAKPLLEMRASREKVNGREMPYIFPRLDYNWTLVSEGPAPYSAARRNLAILCGGIGDARGETYTQHSPKNLPPTAANQMSFDQMAVTIIGHWPSTSRMPERYDSSVCANELRLRNTIVQRMASGWSLAPAYHIPNTIDCSVRIGKETEQALTSELVVATDWKQAVDAPGTDLAQTTAISPGEGEDANEGHDESSEQVVDDPLQADQLGGDLWINPKRNLTKTTEGASVGIGVTALGNPNISPIHF